MVYIAIVDDEKTFIQTYKKEVLRIFSELGFECEINTYTDPAAFQKEVVEIKYDLIFLDIDMPGISGMEIASELNKSENNAVLIFVSNHSNFVFEAFRYSAYRFIRKDNLLSDTAEAVCSFCNTLKTKENYITLDLENKKDVPINLSGVKYFSPYAMIYIFLMIVKLQRDWHYAHTHWTIWKTCLQKEDL